jgi:hypothetical protein
MIQPDKKELIAKYKGRKIMGGVYAIKNGVTGRSLLLSAQDLQGSKNRFEFAQKTGSCVHPRLKDDWEVYGGKAFSLEMLEKLEKMETQTPDEFKEDIRVLLEIWLEKFDSVERSG